MTTPQPALTKRPRGRPRFSTDEAIRRVAYRRAGEGPLTPNALWLPGSEAQSFFELMRRGEIDMEQARDTIQMTAAQRGDLERNFTVDGRTLRTIQNHRLRTWKAFQEICRKAGLTCPD